MGRTRVMVATLEVNSVMKSTTMHTTNTKMNIGNEAKLYGKRLLGLQDRQREVDGRGVWR